jgi:threonylcarbamoyladenosine tRNA methylthiotransferase MtaB
MKRIAFKTLGCKTNQYDTECMMEACRRAGLEVVTFDAEADAYVINTCTVTALADAEGRQVIRRAKRRAPKALVIACGCSVQNEAEEVRNLQEVDAVFGVRCMADLLCYLREELDIKHDEFEMTSLIPTDQSRARALLKVQDGCNKRCTYCAVWRARGPSRSLALDEVYSAYQQLSFYPEIMLTGVHIGQYGNDLYPPTSVYELLEILLKDNQGPRIRLNSLDPDECDDRLVNILAHPRMCRHVHLSVQSCDEDVLRAMGRTYRLSHVKKLVETLVSRIPGVAVGMDLIAGFPGESEEQHKNTKAFLEQLPVAFLHVFPFSARPGSKAAAMGEQIAKDVRKARARELIEIGKVKKKEFLRHLVGQSLEAVVVSRKRDKHGTVKAVSDNYATIRSTKGVYGELIRVRVVDADDEEVHGNELG